MISQRHFQIYELENLNLHPKKSDIGILDSSRRHMQCINYTTKLQKLKLKLEICLFDRQREHQTSADGCEPSTRFICHPHKQAGYLHHHRPIRISGQTVQTVQTHVHVTMSNITHGSANCPHFTFTSRSQCKK